MKIRCHVFDIPYTTGEKKWTFCGHPVKVQNFCEMMKDYIEIIYYGHERSEVDCSEKVVVTNDYIFQKSFGDFSKPFYWEGSGIGDLAHRMFNANALEALRKRYQKNDFMLLMWGRGHAFISDNFKHDRNFSFEHVGHASHAVTERRIYNSNFSRAYHGGKVYSHFPHFLDPVIPNCVNPNLFEYGDSSKKGYMLYVGRVIAMKGLMITIKLAIDTGIPLIIAGPGNIDHVLENSPYKFGIKKGDLNNYDIEIIGQVDAEDRLELMRDASMFVMPTLYAEPGAKVILESLYSGTPVITAKTGGSPEYNVDGITGYNCLLYSEYLEAVNNIHTINSKDCRDWIEDGFTFNSIAPQYMKYFESILNYTETKNFWKV